MRPQLIIQAANIIIRGQFIPTMFHPAWFATQNLIRQQEAEEAEIKVIVPDVAVFEAEWLQVEVTRDRFRAASFQEAFYESLRDVVVGTFTVLHQTPLRVMGINQEFHYEFDSEKAWHAVGNRLAPKPDWDEMLDNPGMKSLTMEGKRTDDYTGYIQVRVAPSTRARFGVFIEVNDHYVLTSEKEISASTSDLETILSEKWLDSMKRSWDIAKKISAFGDLSK